MKLEVRNLCFSYSSRDVVKHVSFEAKSGECVAVLGVNGVGKSTMLKCMNRILKPSSGEILVDSENIFKLNQEEMARRIGYVSQSCEFADATVFDAVLLGRKPFIHWDVTHRDLEIVQNILHTMSLSSFASREINELSGGERQKVSIARALAQQTPILLFDEPTSNLDLKNQLEVLDIIHNIVRENNLIAIVTLHDLNLALRFADKFLIMKEGEVYAFGGADIITEKNIYSVYGIHAELIDYGTHKVIVPQ